MDVSLELHSMLQEVLVSLTDGFTKIEETTRSRSHEKITNLNVSDF